MRICTCRTISVHSLRAIPTPRPQRSATQGKAPLFTNRMTNSRIGIGQADRPQTIVVTNGKGNARINRWSRAMPEIRRPIQTERFALPIVGRGAEPLLNSHEAAQFLGVHPRTLQRMVIRGEISGVRVGRLWRFLPSSITRWVEEHDLAS